MIVRMIHPQHGAMHVYSTAELEWHRKLGWAPEGEAAEVASDGDSHIELIKEPIKSNFPSISPSALVLPVVADPRDALIKPLGLDEGRDEMAPKRKPGRPRKGQ